MEAKLYIKEMGPIVILGSAGGSMPIDILRRLDGGKSGDVADFIGKDGMTRVGARPRGF